MGQNVVTDTVLISGCGIKFNIECILLHDTVSVLSTLPRDIIVTRGNALYVTKYQGGYEAVDSNLSHVQMIISVWTLFNLGLKKVSLHMIFYPYLLYA